MSEQPTYWDNLERGGSLDFGVRWLEADKETVPDIIGPLNRYLDRNVLGMVFTGVARRSKASLAS